MITKGLRSINLVENSSGMCVVMLLLRLLPQVVSTLAHLCSSTCAIEPQHEKSTALPRTLNVTTTKGSGLDSNRHRAAGSWELPPVKHAPKPLIVGYSEALAWNFRGLVNSGIQLVRS